MIPAKVNALVLCASVVFSCAATAAEPTFSLKASIDTRDGLVINGESISSAKMLADARAERSLVLYTSAGEEYERQFADRFKADTGIDVKIVRLVVNRLSERVLSENGAGKLAADVIRMSDAPTIKVLQDAHVFQSYRVPFDARLDGNAKVSEAGYFYRYSSSVYTVGYNSELVKNADAPKSWKDLLNPKWKGRIGIVNVGAGGSSAALARFLLTKYGEDFLRAYAAQNPRILDSASGLLTGMARGEILVGHVIPARVRVARGSGAPVTFIIPEEGMSGWDFYIGATQSSKKSAGKLFINWVMSKYGQQLLAELGDYAARTDVAPPVVMGIALPPLSRVFRMNVDEATRTQAPDQNLWYKIFHQK